MHSIYTYIMQTKKSSVCLCRVHRNPGLVVDDTPAEKKTLAIRSDPRPWLYNYGFLVSNSVDY